MVQEGTLQVRSDGILTASGMNRTDTATQLRRNWLVSMTGGARIHALDGTNIPPGRGGRPHQTAIPLDPSASTFLRDSALYLLLASIARRLFRSEERRVGKECRR